MTRFLTSAPTKFSLANEPERGMVRQWDRFIETLGCAGDVSIEYIEPDSGLCANVFPANAALISGGLAILSSFRRPERRREANAYRGILAKAGFATTYLEQTFFEAADTLFDRARPILYAGHGARTERTAATQIAEMLGVRTVPLFLVDERFYHLDTCLCPLASGHVVAFLDAFSAQAQARLRRTIGPDYLIEVSAEDALGFACNAVEVGDAIVLHDASRKLRERLHAAGYRIFATDLSHFHKAGGSAKCLTLKLDDGPVCVEAAA